MEMMGRSSNDWDFGQAVLESGVEDEVVAWAEARGWVVRKMQYIGRVGCPDRFFFGFGVVVLIEFKKPGGRLRETQKKEHARLAAVGVKVHVHDTVPGAQATLRGFML